MIGRSHTVITQNSNSPLVHMPGAMLQRKCACGGASGLTGSCSDCEKKKLLGKPLQAKLRINVPGDEYEQEADRMAEQVIRMPDPTKESRTFTTATAPLVQRKVNANIAGSGTAPPIVHDVLASRGQPLDAATRAFFEPRFGHDFGHVRVHRDQMAADSARSINALAYTRGTDIVFGAGQYCSNISSDKRLLAHELMHVLQQENTSATAAAFSDRIPQAESGAASTPSVQRTEGRADEENFSDEDVPLSTWAIAEFENAGTLRDPERGMAPLKGGQRIPAGEVVFPLDHKEESGITYIWVEWSGGIDWVLQSDLVEFDPTYATPLGEDESKQSRFKKRTLPYKTQAAETYISGKETIALDSNEVAEFRRNVELLLATKKLTKSQRELLKRAIQFYDDGSIKTPERMEKIGLDADLLSRIKTFYRFLVHEGLITGNVVGKGLGTYGARTPQTAHELSTKWMLNNKNTGRQNILAIAAKRMEFAKLLVEIRGKDQVTDTTWADEGQVKMLSEALMAIRYGEADLEIARFLIPPSHAGGWAGSLDWTDPRIEAIVDKYQLPDDYKQSFEHQWDTWPAHTEHFVRFLEKGVARRRLAIDLIVADIRNHFSQKEQEPQEAPALEGYPKDARARYPNLLDVEMTEHLSGDAADIHFDYKFNYYDPIIDALALVFGLRRAAIGAGEYWHYQAVGQPFAGTQSTEERPPE